MKEATAKRVALYVRVSGTEQAERGTVETQLEFLKNYARLHSWEIIETYRDEPVSGSSVVADRPDGGRLLRDAQRGRFEAVLVYKLDRLARSVYQLHEALQVLDAAGVAFLSATESFDTATPYGRVILNLMAAFAEWERDLISERSHEGRKRNAREGRWPGGPPPLGYRVEAGVLVVDQEPIAGQAYSEAALIERIFTDVAAGTLSVRKLAVQLNTERVPTGQACNYPRHKTGKHLPAGWLDTSLRRILRNPVYRGEMVYGKGKSGAIAAAAPAIVTPSLWYAAQAQLANNAKFSARNSKRVYLLRGLIHCEECGRVMSGFTPSRDAEQRRYYACRGRYDPLARAAHGQPCRTPYLAAEALEEQIWADIVCYAENPQKALAELARDLEARRGQQETLQAEVDHLTSLLKAVDDHRRRALSLFIRGQVDEREKDLLLAEIEAEATALEERATVKRALLSACGEQAAQFTMAEQLLARFKAIVHRPGLTPTERQQIVRGAVLSIEARTNGDAAVRYVFDRIEHTACSNRVSNWAGFEVIYQRK